MKVEIILTIMLSLVSCGHKQETDKGIYAGKISERVRDGWSKSRRSVAVVADNLQATEEIGVSVIPNEATEGESDAFNDVRFRYSAGCYRSEDINARTADSTASVFMCYPCHRGILAHDTITLTAPFGENLYGVEISRKAGNEITVEATFKSAMTLLSVVLESDDIRDILTALSIRGNRIITEARYMPYTGKWLDGQSRGKINITDVGCLLNNGRTHLFYLVPTSEADDITLIVTVNGRDYTLNITLPPMSAGAVTRLHIRKKADGFAVSGSWVETERRLDTAIQAMPDSVCEGWYLQRNGMIQETKDSLSVAVVMETDGRHGKAVSLRDCEGTYIHGTQTVRGIRKFPTIDGKHSEGTINPKLSKHSDISDKIIFMPGLHYANDCALGYADGPEITNLLLRGITEKENIRLLDETGMLYHVKNHPGSYIPTLAELAELYRKMNEGHSVLRDILFATGMYITCSESGDETIYAMDMLTGEASGYVSKRHGRLNLRLFYLF